MFTFNNRSQDWLIIAETSMICFCNSNQDVQGKNARHTKSYILAETCSYLFLFFSAWMHFQPLHGCLLLCKMHHALQNTPPTSEDVRKSPLTVPPHNAHWWQIHKRHVQQNTLSFSWCCSHWSLSVSSSAFPPPDGVHSWRVSSCCVTSSAHRQFTSSCRCKDALRGK